MDEEKKLSCSNSALFSNTKSFHFILEGREGGQEDLTLRHDKMPIGLCREKSTDFAYGLSLTSNKLSQIERTPNFSTILDLKDHCNSAQSWIFSTRLDVVAKRFINRNCKVVLGNSNFTHQLFSTKKNQQIQNWS